MAERSKRNSSKNFNIILAIVGVLACLVAIIVAYFITSSPAVRPLHYKLENKKEAWTIVELQAGIKAIPNDEEFWVSHTSCVVLQDMSLKFGKWFSDDGNFCDNIKGNIWGTFTYDGNNIVMTLYYDGHIATYAFLGKDINIIERYTFKKGQKTSDARPLLIKSSTMEKIEGMKISL